MSSKENDEKFIIVEPLKNLHGIKTKNILIEINAKTIKKLNNTVYKLKLEKWFMTDVVNSIIK